MDYFDFITEEEINEIKKCDCLYCKDIISLDNKKNRKLLDFYVYQQYLQNTSNETEADNKGGVACE